jgi:hypothetical protein
VAQLLLRLLPGQSDLAAQLLQDRSRSPRISASRGSTPPPNPRESS